MKVLVVDDETFVTETMGRFIGRLGHTPLTAENGTRAIELYKENKPDLVLLDINLPDIKGDRVFKEIISFDKDAIIYFVTGYREEYIKAQALNAAGYFIKPFTMGQIKQVIDERKKIIDEAGLNS